MDKTTATPTATPAELKSTLALIYAVAEAIREAGPIPSGHLYARLMGMLTLVQYEKIISVLKGARVITEKGNLLTWSVSDKK